jgi:hypothetical protein
VEDWKMKKRYKTFKYPVEALEKDLIRKTEFEKKIREIIKKPVKIPMTAYFRFRASKPLFVYDDELISAFTKKKTRGFNLL